MASFRDRLRAAISRSAQYRSNQKQLSIDAGLGEKTISNMLNDASLDTTPKGPGLIAIGRVADLLNESTDYLRGATGSKVLTESTSTISVADLLRKHHRSGGHRDAFLELIEQCDEYACPTEEDRAILPIRVGLESASAIKMGSPDLQRLRGALAGVPDEDLKARWLRDYRQAGDRGTLVTIETLDHQMPNFPLRIKIDFIRVLLGCTDQDGKRTILNFSVLLN